MAPDELSGSTAMIVRALALDLDGTLLGHDDTVSARNRAAVAAARESGWRVILATARWYQFAERIANDLGLDDPVIACAGADVRRLCDGFELFDVRPPPAFIAAVYALCDEADGTALVYQGRDVILRSPTGHSPAETSELRHVSSLNTSADPDPRCVLVFGHRLKTRILDDLLPTWQSEVRFLTSMTSRGDGALTLTSSRADKGLALAVACRDLDIALSSVVAMGDSEADVEMFRVAGASVAMGQAAACVKAAATWIGAPNEADAVGRAIENLLAGCAPADD